jgi:hypothetical protein
MKNYTFYRHFTYAPKYTYLCLGCKFTRKDFPSILIDHIREGQFDYYICPKCHGKMINVGDSFKPPRKENKKAWAKVIAYIQSGNKYNG